MSALIFPLSNSAFTIGGYFPSVGADVFGNGDLVSQASGQNSQVDFQFHGTALAFPHVYVSATSGNVICTIDGSATTPTFTGTGPQSNQPLVSGLADAVHRATISFPGSQQVIVDATQFISVTGSSPSVSGVSGYGPVAAIPSAGSIAVEGAACVIAFGGYDAVIRSSVTPSGPTYDDVTLRFKGRIGSLYVWMYGDNENLNLDVYDVTGATLQASIPIASYNGNSGWGGWGAGFTGLDTAADHIYELSGAGGEGWLVYQLMTSGGTGIDFTWTPPVRDYVAGGIDSITRAELGTATQSSLGYLRLYARTHGMAVLNLGVGGAAYDNTLSGQSTIGWSSSTTSGSGRYNDLITFSSSHAIQKAFWLGGVNDMIGAISDSTLGAAVQNFISAVNATGSLSSTKHFVLGILPTDYSSLTYSAIAGKNSVISSKVMSAGAQWSYVDTAPWNFAGSAFQSGGAFSSSPNYTQVGGGSDDLHPGPVGYQAMAGFLQALSAASPAILTGMFQL